MITGTQDKTIKERLLREEDLSLEKAVNICRAVEAGRLQVETIQAKEEKKQQVDVVKKRSYNKKQNDCEYCGRRHEARMCPAYGKKCAVCTKYNHFAAVCRNKKKSFEEKREKKGKKKYMKYKKKRIVPVKMRHMV